MEKEITEERMKTEDDEDEDAEFETFVDEDDEDDTYLGNRKLYNRIIIHCSLVLQNLLKKKVL